MDKEEDGGKWLATHKLQKSSSILARHLLKKGSAAAYVRSTNLAAETCIKRLCEMNLPTECFDVYSHEVVLNAIGLSQQKVEWELSVGPLDTLPQRCQNADGLANELRRQVDESQRHLGSLLRQSDAARRRGENRDEYHTQINDERDKNDKLDRDLAFAVTKHDSLEACMQSTSRTKDGCNGVVTNRGERDVLKIAPADLIDAREALSALCAVSESRQGCLTTMVAAARQHPKVFDALRQAVLDTADCVFDDVLLRDERLHPSEWTDCVPADWIKYLHSEVAENGSVMGEYGLIGTPDFDAWLKEYSSFLDQFDEDEGWRSECDKHRDKKRITSIYKSYICGGVYKILKALLERQVRRTQRGEDKGGDEDDLERMIERGVEDILHAESCLRCRLNFELPKNFLDFWELKLGPPNTADLVKEAGMSHLANLTHARDETASGWADSILRLAPCDRKSADE